MILKITTQVRYPTNYQDPGPESYKSTATCGVFTCIGTGPSENTSISVALLKLSNAFKEMG